MQRRGGRGRRREVESNQTSSNASNDDTRNRSASARVNRPPSTGSQIVGNNPNPCLLHATPSHSQCCVEQKALRTQLRTQDICIHVAYIPRSSTGTRSPAHLFLTHPTSRASRRRPATPTSSTARREPLAPAQQHSRSLQRGPVPAAKGASARSKSHVAA